MKGKRSLTMNGTNMQISIIVMLVLPLLGCGVPIRVSGYTPSGPGTSYTSYLVGPKNSLRAKLDRDVEMNISAEKNKGDRTSTIMLHIYFIVPRGNTIQLLSPNFVLESPDWTKPLVLKSLSPTIEIRGDTEVEKSTLGHHNRHTFFTISFREGVEWYDTSVPSVDSFTLRFPELLINGNKRQIDPIAFKYHKKWAVDTVSP